jgi:hypothetical protein
VTPSRTRPTPPAPRPPRERKRRRSSRHVGLAIAAAAIAASIVISAINHTPTPQTTVHIPPITVPPIFGTAPRPHPGVPQSDPLNVGLLTMGIAERVYQAFNGRYTGSAAALEPDGFQPDRSSTYAVGIGGSRGYCIVGGESHDTIWSLFDSRLGYLTSTNYRTEAEAKKACPLPVRWGGNLSHV